MYSKRSAIVVLASLAALLTAACTPAQKAAFNSWYKMKTETAAVMQCIYAHESGDYSEHSHISSGSGAAQFIPATWRYWFGLWRDAVEFVGSDYSYAYEAPPLIQDAVLEFTLTHGGAHNWDPAYGPDDCTVGMP